MIKFGEWRPDASDFDTGYLVQVTNAQPTPDGWGPLPSFEPYTEALPDRSCGAFMARRRDGGYVIYAGTQTHLYRLDPADRSWVEVGSGYHLSDGHFWSFKQFGTDLVASNINDVHQVADIEIGGQFEPLNGIKSRSLCIIGPNLFALSLLNEPDSVYWSETRNIRQFDTNKKGSGSQQFADGGFVVAGFSGETGGYIFQKDAIRLATWQPGNAYNFRFTKISSLGLVGHNAAVKVNQTVFFLAQDGFYSLSGNQVQAIGGGKVDQSFLKRVNLDRLEAVQAVSDPLNKVVYWAYASSGHAGAGYDRIIGYDWQLERWFEIKADISFLARASTPGHTLESLNEISASLDNLAISLDSPAWSGGKPVLAAFDVGNKLCFAHGPVMDAVFETADVEFYAGYRSLLTSCALVSDCADARLEVGTKATSFGAMSWKPEVTRQASGRFPLMANGKHHRFRTTLKGNWSACHGIDDVSASKAGIR